ncbi:hypothetical protein CSUI_008860 [Cystoisospora suis]|uniref:Uncharacterized protein n=1 Tax=Cystoisospora suis TaxID=483139 RepID=A0A2C6KJM7_9APIC|nr:hypothetical protein CSUI_008860 [Cystoisospora suis]
MHAQGQQYASRGGGFQEDPHQGGGHTPGGERERRGGGADDVYNGHNSWQESQNIRGGGNLMDPHHLSSSHSERHGDSFDSEIYLRSAGGERGRGLAQHLHPGGDSPLVAPTSSGGGGGETAVRLRPAPSGGTMPPMESNSSTGNTSSSSYCSSSSGRGDHGSSLSHSSSSTSMSWERGGGGEGPGGSSSQRGGWKEDQIHLHGGPTHHRDSSDRLIHHMEGGAPHLGGGGVLLGSHSNSARGASVHPAHIPSRMHPGSLSSQSSSSSSSSMPSGSHPHRWEGHGVVSHYQPGSSSSSSLPGGGGVNKRMWGEQPQQHGSESGDHSGRRGISEGMMKMPGMHAGLSGRQQHWQHQSAQGSYYLQTEGGGANQWGMRREGSASSSSGSVPLERRAGEDEGLMWMNTGQRNPHSNRGSTDQRMIGPGGGAGAGGGGYMMRGSESMSYPSQHRHVNSNNPSHSNHSGMMASVGSQHGQPSYQQVKTTAPPPRPAVRKVKRQNQF